MTISPDLLHEALDGRSILGPGHGEGAALVRLAATVRRLQPERPSPAAVARMTTRFESLLERPQRPRLFLLLGAWLGVGAQPRPLVQRLAAGALLFASVGGGASVASGVDPVMAIDSTAHFLANAVANLSPRDDGGGSTLSPLPETPTAASAAAPATPTPDATPTSTPAPAPAAASTVDNGAPPAPGTEQPGTSAPSSNSTPEGVSAPPTSAATPTPTTRPTETPTPTPTRTETPPQTTPTETTTPTPAVPAPTLTPSPSPTATATVKATPTSKPDDGKDNH